MADVAVFEENPDGTYDLLVDRRRVEYDVEADEFHDALRRARFDGADVWVEDETGHRERLGRG